MIRKKITAMLIASALSLICLTACGKDKENSITESKTGEVSTVEEDNVNSSSDESNDEDVFNDNEIMLDADSLTDEQIKEFTEILFTAVQKLDIETLKKYTEEDDGSVKVLEEIASTPEYKDLWDKTVGKMIYMPKSCVVLAKSPDWLYSKWYTLKAEEKAEIPESVSKLTLDEVNEFYDKYYEECPYTASLIPDYYIDPYNDDNGRLYFDIGDILEPIGLETISEYNYLAQYDGDQYGVYLFGVHDSLSLGYDYIASEDELPDYETLMSMDLDKMVNIVENFEDKKTGSSIYYECFEKYYKNEENRAIIQKWLNENCVAMRDLSTVKYFYKANLENDYPFYIISRNGEEEYVKDLYIVNRSVWRDFPSGLKSNNDVLGVFYDIAESLINQGLLTSE